MGVGTAWIELTKAEYSLSSPASVLLLPKVDTRAPDCKTTAWPYRFLQIIYLFIYLFIYLWLCWVFVSVRGLPLVAASRGHSSSRCTGLSLSRPLLLWSTGFRRAGSVTVAHGPSCSAACGILPDQGLNPCPLHWRVDSQPRRHQGSPSIQVFNLFTKLSNLLWKRHTKTYMHF